MTPDEFTDYQNSQELHCEGWRCVNCGEMVDPVLMDIVMPEKDGLECIRELHQEFPRAKIVAITGGGAKVGTLNDLDFAAKLGARRTLQKPFALQELLQAVEDELHR